MDQDLPQKKQDDTNVLVKEQKKPKIVFSTSGKILQNIKKLDSEPESDSSEGIISEKEQSDSERSRSASPVLQTLANITLSDQILNLLKEINWKNKLSESEIQRYTNLYENICTDISYMPKVIDILQLSMPYADKCELFEKMILLNNMTPTTSEFYDLKKYLNGVITEYKTFLITTTEYKHYKTLEESLVVLEKTKPIEYQILDLDISDYNKSFIYKRYKSLKQESSNYQYNNKLKKWIEWIISIPTNVQPMGICLEDTFYEKNKYLCGVKNALDREIYGLQHVKEKVLFLLNNKITNASSKGLNFALSGPPGVAKTSIINVLSKSINLPFFQINAAGMKDSSFLLGHNFTYEGSTPGAIVQALSAMQCKNGIIYFDEFDKISNTEQGIEISNTLLHITDFSQNNKFHDRYISEQIDIDLSNIWFIYSMNDKMAIDATLRDRISIIEIDGYTTLEKKEIIKKFLLPAAMANINLDIKLISIDESALDYLIEISGDSDYNVNSKSGVRQVKHLLEEILMKINLLRTTTPSVADKQVLQLSFSIAKFALPLVITKSIIVSLQIKKDNVDKSFQSMYC